MSEVDELLDRVDDAWINNDRSICAADIQGMCFTPVRLREGYSMREVDRHLDHLAAVLHARETGTL